MKIKEIIGLFALTTALSSLSTQAQTLPTGTATTTSYPQGAVAPDSTPAQGSRSQKRAMRKSQSRMNQNSRRSGNTTTTVEDARYRQSSSSDGTSINNSNVTNYNSNNVTTAPTGAGSNPNNAKTTPTKKP